VVDFWASYADTKVQSPVWRFRQIASEL